MLELKRVKYHETLSEETPCFTADVLEDGKLIAHVSNRGHGGGNEITPANGLSYKDVAHIDNIDTECDIFEMVYDDEARRKLQSKGLVLKKDDKIYTVKYPMAISKLKKHPQGVIWLKRHKTKFIGEDYKILNTNV